MQNFKNTSEFIQNFYFFNKNENLIGHCHMKMWINLRNLKRLKLLYIQLGLNKENYTF